MPSKLRGGLPQTFVCLQRSPVDVSGEPLGSGQARPPCPLRGAGGAGGEHSGRRASAEGSSREQSTALGPVGVQVKEGASRTHRQLALLRPRAADCSGGKALAARQRQNSCLEAIENQAHFRLCCYMFSRRYQGSF